MGALSWSEGRAREIIAEQIGLEGPALPILHAIQAEFGCVPAAVVPIVADALNLSRAEVHGIVSFYHDFRDEPAPGRLVKLCRAEACQARGVDALAAYAQAKHGSTATIEAAYCLGLCACGPAALVDGIPYAHLTPERFDALLAGAL